MLNIGDKIVLKKAMGAFTNVGEVCEVKTITDNLIGFSFGNGIHMGYMSEDELNKYFEVQKPAENVAETIIEKMISESDILTQTVFNKCTIVTIRLPNGYVISEYSACVSPDDYDEDLGYKICIDKIKNKLTEMEAYRLMYNLNDNRKFDW